MFGADATHGRPSAASLRLSLASGSLVACEIVWAEVAVAFPSAADAARAMSVLEVSFSPVDVEVALAAGTAFKAYRAAGGARERLPADFMIGAHAQAHADRLLTRDRGFYRAYFKELTVLQPG